MLFATSYTIRSALFAGHSGDWKQRAFARDKQLLQLHVNLKVSNIYAFSMRWTLTRIAGGIQSLWLCTTKPNNIAVLYCDNYLIFSLPTVHFILWTFRRVGLCSVLHLPPYTVWSFKFRSSFSDNSARPPSCHSIDPKPLACQLQRWLDVTSLERVFAARGLAENMQNIGWSELNEADNRILHMLLLLHNQLLEASMGLPGISSVSRLAVIHPGPIYKISYDNLTIIVR